MSNELVKDMEIEITLYKTKLLIHETQYVLCFDLQGKEQSLFQWLSHSQRCLHHPEEIISRNGLKSDLISLTPYCE